MDSIRRKLIELVRERNLLWDPTHANYKSKDLRKEAWDEIDAQLQLPPGAKTTAKYMWDALTRGFANSMKRRDKRMESGVNGEVSWKFEKNMLFLLPAKRLRRQLKPLSEHSNTEMDFDNHSAVSNDAERETYWDGDVFTEVPASHNPEKNIVSVYSRTKSSHSKKRVKEELEYEEEEEDEVEEEDYNDDDEVVPVKMQREDDNDINISSTSEYVTKATSRSTGESPRLSFFRSLMPVVDSFSNDEFLTMQMDIIQVIQKHRQARNALSQHHDTENNKDTNPGHVHLTTDTHSVGLRTPDNQLFK